MWEWLRKNLTLDRLSPAPLAFPEYFCSSFVLVYLFLVCICVTLFSIVIPLSSDIVSVASFQLFSWVPLIIFTKNIFLSFCYSIYFILFYIIFENKCDRQECVTVDSICLYIHILPLQRINREIWDSFGRRLVKPWSTNTCHKYYHVCKCYLSMWFD